MANTPKHKLLFGIPYGRPEETGKLDPNDGKRPNHRSNRVGPGIQGVLYSVVETWALIVGTVQRMSLQKNWKQVVSLGTIT